MNMFLLYLILTLTNLKIVVYTIIFLILETNFSSGISPLG